MATDATAAATPSPLHMDTCIFAFVGSGNMASALIRGLLRSPSPPPAGHIRVSSPRGGSPDLATLGITCTASNATCVRGADVIVLCVKPHILHDALASCADCIPPHSILVSIVAGVTMDTISTLLPFHPPKLCRAMPNTPAAILHGATALCSSATVSQREAAFIASLFAAVGTVDMVKEAQLDAVTGLSGSGPAFAFMFIEALADGGVAAGLPRGTAMALAAQMVKGAAALVQESGKHPGELKDSVASPGGTTIAGIRALERGAFRGTVMEAVVAAAGRATELRKA